MSGDQLKRAPTGFAPDDPDIELLKLKDVTFGRTMTDAEAGSANLPAELAATFAKAIPLLGLLSALPGNDEPAGWLRG